MEFQTLSILTRGGALIEAFGIKKSHTSAYHPEVDEMVERLTRSLLQLLRTYAQRQDDWEKHLPLVLYAY